MPRTKTEESLADAERAHAHDPERSEMIARARRFKSSWFELAEALSDIRRREGFKKWGYANFEDYFRRELHLKRETVEKLTGSFAFLRARAPEVLTRDARDAPIPTYQAVDFLRRAEEEAQAPEETLREIRRQVLDEGAPLPKVSRLYRTVLFPLEAEAEGEKRRQGLATTIDKLIELLAHARADEVVPGPLAAEVEEPLARLAAYLANRAA